MKVKRKIIEINDELCDGCGQCVPACAEGAIEIRDGKARIVSERFCDGLGACLGECPNNAIRIIEREAEEFDEGAVETYLAEKEKPHKAPEVLPSLGCPSTRIQTFSPKSEAAGPVEKGARVPSRSALTHWPVQINLVPATAPFLRGADLLVVADCVPLAYPGLHHEFLPGRVVLLGCPKFDDVKGYVQKFVDIFKTAQIKSVTILSMEVPCCSGLATIVKRAMEAAGKRIPTQEIVISTRGGILDRERGAA
jgi:NAD-dependent dihydropyrimidine dehydrogenase PreA subunit